MSVLGKIIFYTMLTLIVVFATIIIFFLFIAFSDYTSYVISSNAAPIANLGQDALLSCYLNVESVRQMSVTWTKTGQQGLVYQYKNGAVDLQDQNSQYKGRTQLFPDALVSGNASLMIRNVRRGDEGGYMCRISSSERGGKVNIHLHTAAYTAPTFTYSNSVLTAQASRWLPKPNVTWLNLDRDVLKGNTTLSLSSRKIYSLVSTVQPASVNDTYMCKIETELVISVSKATVTGSGVLEDTYFTFNVASSLLASAGLSITTSVLFLCYLT